MEILFHIDVNISDMSFLQRMNETFSHDNYIYM